MAPDQDHCGLWEYMQLPLQRAQLLVNMNGAIAFAIENLDSKVLVIVSSVFDNITHHHKYV